MHPPPTERLSLHRIVILHDHKPNFVQKQPVEGSQSSDRSIWFYNGYFLELFFILKKVQSEFSVKTTIKNVIKLLTDQSTFSEAPAG